MYIFLISLILAVISVKAAIADTVEEFYRGKYVTIAIGFSAGGDYDLRARLLARHMDRFIPGTPTLIARNMPGAGGIAATNWLAKLAPLDGTSLLMASQNTPLIQALGTPGVEFDARQFFWIGNTTNSPNLISVWAGRGVTSVEDAKGREVTVGATGVGSGSYYYPIAANIIGGTRFKIVTGYPGGNDINIAMERGEVDGRGSNSLAAWLATRPSWISEKKIIHLVQIALNPHPDLIDVPLLSDLATTDIDKQAMHLLAAETAMARSIAASPEVPLERVAALRKAFNLTLTSKEFLSEADKLGFDINAASGEEVQSIVNNIVNAPIPVIQRVREILNTK